MADLKDAHPFDTAITLEAVTESEWAGAPSPDYANMVGSFGGITTATVLNAVMRDARFMGDPVSMTINLCSGMNEDSFTISTKLCRTGKYTQHWSLELVQGGKLCATATIVCGRRGDVYSHQSFKVEDVPRAEDVKVTDTLGFLKWLERYSFRFVEGMPNMSGKPNPEPNSARSVLWVSDNPPRPLDHLSLAAMADCFLLRLFQVRGTMVPMGSVSITTHFLATAEEITAQGSAPILAIADSTRFNGNFHDQQIQMLSSTGTILATGTQLVWYRQ